MRVAPLLVVIGLVAGCAGSDAANAPATTTVAPAVTATTATTAPTDPRAVAPVASAGCGSGAAGAVAPGQDKITMTSGREERWYFRHVPPAHDGAQPVPVIVDLHGYSEGAEVHVALSGLPAYGDEQGFVTLTPQGRGAIAFWQPSPSAASTDMVFLSDMLDQVEAGLCVDTARVFVTGLSNGAMMTSAVACALADRVAAVAPVAGVTPIDGCTLSRPVPVVAFHGTEDQYLSYDGGFGPATGNLPAPDGSDQTLGDLGATVGGGPSVEEVVAAWASRNGCEGEPERDAVAADVTELVYPCPVGDEAELYRIEGGGHTWPGSELTKQAVALLGMTTFSISANEVMWQFFLDHPLPAA
jgi:polyhydroxybutyrate depolymerase